MERPPLDKPRDDDELMMMMIMMKLEIGKMGVFRTK